jgi:hypothetical protein
MVNHLHNLASLFLAISVFFQFSQLVVSHSFPILDKHLIRTTHESDVPTVWSYHIHGMFINGDEIKIKQALELRNKFIQHFKLENVTNCQDLFSDIRLCMFGKLFLK